MCGCQQASAPAAVPTGRDVTGGRALGWGVGPHLHGRQGAAAVIVAAARQIQAVAPKPRVSKAATIQQVAAGGAVGACATPPRIPPLSCA